MQIAEDGQATCKGLYVKGTVPESLFTKEDAPFSAQHMNIVFFFFR